MQQFMPGKRQSASWPKQIISRNNNFTFHIKFCHFPPISPHQHHFSQPLAVQIVNGHNFTYTVSLLFQRNGAFTQKTREVRIGLPQIHVDVRKDTIILAVIMHFMNVTKMRENLFLGKSPTLVIVRESFFFGQRQTIPTLASENQEAL